MNTLTPEGNKLIDSIVRSHDDAVRAAERERIAKFVEGMDDGPITTKAVKSYVAAAIRADDGHG